jgi:hypothetical protein
MITLPEPEFFAITTKAPLLKNTIPVGWFIESIETVEMTPFDEFEILYTAFLTKSVTYRFPTKSRATEFGVVKSLLINRLFVRSYKPSGLLSV